MAFTELFIKNLKPRVKEYFENEGRGFIVRVHPSGAKTFYIRYSFSGKQKKLSLGDYPYVSLATAREKYHDALKLVRSGIDPALPLPAPSPEPDQVTVKKMCEEYLIWSKEHHAADWSYIIDKTINKHIIPTIGDTLLTEITRRSAIQFLSEIGTAGAARMVYKTIRGVFQYAVDREYIMASPFTRLAKPVPTLVPQDRKRILSPSELK